MARRNLALLACALVILALVPIAPLFVQYVATRAAIAALFALGFNLVFGFGGMASFGHAALAGGGAYALALLQTQAHAADPVLALTVIAYGAFVGAILGVATLKTRGIYVLLLTLVIAQSLWGLVSQNDALTGGDNGITGIVRPAWLASDTAFALLAVGSAFVAAAAMLVLVEARFGRLLVAARSNENRLRSLGVDAAPYRIGAFVISGIICALAGALGALFRGSVNPALLDWPASANVLIATIVGGATTVLGPPLAAIGLIVLETLAGSTQRWPTILGAIFVVTALFLPRGIGGRSKRRERFTLPTEIDERQSGDVTASRAGNALKIEHLDFTIGGRRLFADFSLALVGGERRAIVGPNGVGKSTLFALICGERLVDRGSIRFDGHDITRATPSARARDGIGRTYQFGALFDDHTVAQNLRVAALAANLPPNESVARALRGWGLVDERDRLPHELSAGRRRIVELALSTLAQPKLMLLDEPTAGLSRAEIADVIAAIRSLPIQTTLLVIEHDADVANAITDHVTQLEHVLDS